MGPDKGCCQAVRALGRAACGPGRDRAACRLALALLDHRPRIDRKHDHHACEAPVHGRGGSVWPVGESGEDEVADLQVLERARCR